MALDETEIQFGGGTAVLLAPVGSTVPDDLTTAWDAAWVDIGYVTEAGVTFDPSEALTEVLAWQSDTPVLRRVVRRDVTVSFSMEQLNEQTFITAFGGGTWTFDAGVGAYTPPTGSDQYETAVGWEWADGDNTWRAWINRCNVSDLATMVLTRPDPVLLPITLSSLAVVDSAPWGMLTDSANILAVIS